MNKSSRTFTEDYYAQRRPAVVSPNSQWVARAFAPGWKRIPMVAASRPVVRLEFAPGADPTIREMLQERFNLAPVDVYDLPGERDYTSLFQNAALPVASLRDSAWTPLPHPAIENSHDIFAAIRAGDILVDLFRCLTGHSQMPVCSALLVAPEGMRPRLIELIEREIAKSERVCRRASSPR